MAASSIDRSLERIVPGALSADDATGQETYALHSERYRFAAGFAAGKRVLDCACGVGYGTAILAEAGADSVTGVDIDPDAVAYASEHYSSPQISFYQGDGTILQDDSGFDVVVSLETVEHVPDPRRLLANFERLLRPGGMLIASVPVTPSVDVNPYHLHDFTKASFRELGRSLGFTEDDALSQDQPFDPFKIATGREERLADIRPGLAAYYARHPGAFLARIRSTVVDGFKNKYLTIAWRKSA